MEVEEVEMENDASDSDVYPQVNTEDEQSVLPSEEGECESD